MPYKLKRESVAWILVIFLTALSIYAAESHRDLRNRYERTVDSLQTVHQQTARELTDAKRLANSNAEGLSNAEEREVLWATRAVISETNNPREMLLIANVIRNRVDLGYRGQETAKEVILDPYQFSAFNPGRKMRWRYINMEAQHVSQDRWEEAWQAARFAMTAPREVLPFDNPCVNHFVHPDGLAHAPNWIFTMEQVSLGDVQRPDVLFFKQEKQNGCLTDRTILADQTRQH